MEFRPCIDIHNGKVKQIVGGTLKDQGDLAAENFVSEQDAPFTRADCRWVAVLRQKMPMNFCGQEPVMWS